MVKLEKSNKWILIILIILTCVVVGFCFYSVIKNNDLKDSDASKFYHEYTEYNGKINDSNGLSYVNVNINDTNNIKYLTSKEAIELLESGTGVIYFGFPTCPWCRSLVSPLLEVAQTKNETIYYLNILDMRSSFSLSEGKISKTSEGSEKYYQILELLDEYLEEFVLEDEAGNTYDTGEKRLYAPSLVAVKDGEVTSFHEGTIDSQNSGYDELSEEELNELKQIITKLIDSKNTSVCTNDKC